MKHLVLSTFWNTLASGLQVVLNIARMKLLALLLGPYGVGILSQITTYLTLLSTIPAGLGTGIVKHTAEYAAQDRQRLAQLLTTVKLSLAVLGLASFIVGVVFSHQIAYSLFGDENLAVYVVLGSIGLPFNFLVSVSQSFIQGLKEIPLLSKVKIVAALVSLGLLVPMILFWKLSGAILHLGVFAAVNMILVAVVWHYLRSRRLPEARGGSFDSGILRIITLFGVVSIANLAAKNGAFLGIRILIGHQLDMQAVGIFHAAFVMSTRYLPMVMSTIVIYLLPHLSGISDRQIINAELNRILRFFLVLITPIIMIVIGLREVLIPFIYSREFLPATDLLPPQLLGDFFKITAYTLGAALLPLGRLRASLLFGVSSQLIFFLLSFGLLQQFGLVGVPTAYALVRGLYLVLIYLYLRKQINFRFDGRYIRLWLISAAAVITMVMLPTGGLYYLALLATLIIWGLLSIDRNDIKQLRSILTTHNSRDNGE
ncbi:oligosaccharide flippase family protein [Candidatus Neomarinimicrobiota bacterium]